VEIYARVRRAVLVEGVSRRAAAREFGLARKTVSKMLAHGQTDLRAAAGRACLCWRLPAPLAAQKTDDHNGLKRELRYTGRHVPPASFALHHEQLASLYSEGHQNQHRRTEAEHTDKTTPVLRPRFSCVEHD
jgi:hypothetical protein